MKYLLFLAVFVFSLSLFTCGQSHEGEVQIKFTLPAQTEIIAAEGERVLLDVSACTRAIDAGGAQDWNRHGCFR